MAGGGHRFRIVVERVDAAAAGPVDAAPLAFELALADDLLPALDQVRGGTAFSREEASALALGVKLLGGVALAHRDDPLFADLQPALRAFTGNLKSRVASSAAPTPTRRDRP